MKHDCEAVIDIFKILRSTVDRITARSPPAPTGKKKVKIVPLTDLDIESIVNLNKDVMGRVLPELSLTHVSKHPCLAMLYRHALTWQTPESGLKTGKANGFLAYAYLLYVGWRVYGDTIGRMITLDSYINLRASLFSFLGQHCQPTLDDFFNPSQSEPSRKLYANWDHKVIDKFVDRFGKPLVNQEGEEDRGIEDDDEEVVEVESSEDEEGAATSIAGPSTGGSKSSGKAAKAGKGGKGTKTSKTTKATPAKKPRKTAASAAQGRSKNQPATMYSTSAVKLFDATRMEKQTASVKKIIDFIGKNRLALGPSFAMTPTTVKERAASWSPDIADLTEEIAVVRLLASFDFDLSHGLLFAGIHSERLGG